MGPMSDEASLSLASFNATTRAHGLYDPLRFVVRLSPLIHQRLEGLTPGAHARLGKDDLRAYSVFLHETFHWWQHTGSTIGLISSLTYPSQTHANLKHLRQFLREYGPVKSIQGLLTASKENEGLGTRSGNAHTILNNSYDFAIFRALLNHPDRMPTLIKHPYFSGELHTHVVSFTNVIAALSHSVDKSFSFVPNAPDWLDRYNELAARPREPERIGIPPVGLYEIFEGQARFNQSLFLTNGSGGSYSWDELRQQMSFGSPYKDAFEVFLKVVGLSWPDRVIDPTVGLFLLVCDLAINPVAGFPFGIPDFEKFVAHMSPGRRFLALCLAVKSIGPSNLSVVDYSSAEYLAIATKLTDACGFEPVTASGDTIRTWVADSPSFQNLASRQSTFGFPDENHPVGFLLGHFAAFALDRRLRPEFFCWPGMFLAGPRATSDEAQLFEKHAPPFVDKENDDGITPRIKIGLSEGTVRDEFQKFYSANVLYDLVEQWIIKPGPFTYQLQWLATKQPPQELQGWAENVFSNCFGIRPNQFKIL